MSDYQKKKTKRINDLAQSWLKEAGPDIATRVEFLFGIIAAVHVEAMSNSPMGAFGMALDDMVAEAKEKKP